MSRKTKKVKMLFKAGDIIVSTNPEHHYMAIFLEDQSETDRWTKCMIYK